MISVSLPDWMSTVQLGSKKPVVNEDGRWVTMSGRHVYIEDGVVTKGPKELLGLKREESKEGIAHQETEHEHAVLTLADRVNGLYSMSDEEKKKVVKNIGNALETFSPKALEGILQNVKEYRIVPLETTKREASTISNAVAYYDRDQKILCTSDTVHNSGDSGTIAHEMAHALDNETNNYSSSTQFHKVWREEIGSKRKPIGDYATTNSEEGFGEAFYYLNKWGLEATRRTIPRTMAYLESEGLVADKISPHDVGHTHTHNVSDSRRVVKVGDLDVDVVGPLTDEEVRDWVKRSKEGVENAFCPTGKGGKQDNSCPPNRKDDTLTKFIPERDSEGSLEHDIDNSYGTSDEYVRGILEYYGAELLDRDFIGQPMKGVYVTDDGIVEWDGEGDPSFTDKNSWVLDYDIDEARTKYEDQFNSDFWEGGGILYHATDSENVDSILESGITASANTRGMTNRGEGPGVYTTADLDEAEYGSYGNSVFEIDAVAMAKDKIKPYVSQEPDVVEGELRGSLANLVGHDRFNYDYESGMSPNTIVLGGSVPAKYVKLVGK